MDHPVDKKLAVWLQAKNYCQWINVQVEAKTSDIPEGLGLGPGPFTIIGGDMDSGIECNLFKLVDGTKLCDTVSKLEGKDAIQRDLGKTEISLCELCKVQQGKVPDPAAGSWQSQTQVQDRWRMD